jgi:uncharacterized membrane protein (DUF4010 family)
LNEDWLRFGAALGIGLLIGLERERNPAAKAGARTFALVALFGALAAAAAARLDGAWLVPVGLAAVAAMLIGAYARDGAAEDPGTTTVIAALVCYLLGVLAGLGEEALAGALAIAVTALLYFKPEIEGASRALSRQEQVSILQFLVVTFIVLPILPDRGYGPYAALNPRHVWLMVVLISGIGLASYVALRFARERHGLVMAGVLGGLLSSTATTVLYARRSRGDAQMERFAQVVVPIANLVPLARIGVLAAVLAPALLRGLLPALGAALAAGMAATALSLRRVEHGVAPPVAESRNPAELGTALRFAALYALVLLLSAWLSDLAGSRGLYAAALAAGIADIDPIVLSAFNLSSLGSIPPAQAITAIALAYSANVAFKLGVLFWFNPRLALRVAAPMAATVAAGAAALLAG